MPKKILIIGAGQAGGWAAMALRNNGFEGKLVIFGDEAHPPYERPPLSKGILLGLKTPESTYIWSQKKLAAANIDLHLGQQISAIDRTRKQAELWNGCVEPYGQLIIATGSRVKKLAFEGDHFSNIHYLRRIDDATTLGNALVPTSNLLVVGGGWIGLEVSAAARMKGLNVTLIEAGTQLCARALPRDLSEFLSDEHTRRGVSVRFGTTIQKITGRDKGEFAHLSNGEVIPISAVAIGIGVTPNVELARKAGLDVENGILVDEFGRTSDPFIFAAGDVTNQIHRFTGGRIRLESWENAQNQAIAVAKGIMGKFDSPRDDVPWFWSDQYDPLK
jgi:3-phenylpropionate/trans-cinnamate dioxygenase ferredoxin reductase subunit